MRLDELLEGLSILDLSNLFPDTEVSAVTSDSRQVSPGAVFVAVPGTRLDGHQYIGEALERGATLVIQSQPLDPTSVGSFVRVANPRRAYGELSAVLAGRPSRRLRVIGVTGTNGKTSTTLIAAHLLNLAGRKAAVLGTLGLKRAGADDFEGTGLTTPDAGVLQQTVAGLVDEGHTHLVMEVSSHALVQERVAGLEFAGGVFTNLSQDHFDYHGSMEAYFEAKALLFTRYLSASQGYWVVNVDDPAGGRLLQQCSGTCVGYGAADEALLALTAIETDAAGTSWSIVLKGAGWPSRLQQGVNYARLSSPLAGRYNAYNCTAAAAVGLLEGLSLAEVEAGLSSFPGVPGRLQRVPNERGVHVYVDYAHTPDALLNVLAALRELREEGARIITVFGCGGDRDPDKRPKMGAAAQIGSDKLYVTSDNPRSEDPEAIIDQVMAGLDPQMREAVVRQSDRAAAIRSALTDARSGDIVLIAGKGHEDYQILADRTIHFSDAEQVEAFFAETAA